MRLPLLLCLITTALLGCASAPEAPAPDDLPLPFYRAPVTLDGIPVEKIEFLADDRLTTLLARAKENNKDIVAAWLSVNRARAMFRMQENRDLPGVGVSLEGRSGRENPHELTSRRYRFELQSTAYELDFFVRVAELKEEALQSFLAEEANTRFVVLEQRALIANTWIGLLELHALHQLAEKELSHSREILELIRARVAEGLDQTSLEIAANQANDAAQTEFNALGAEIEAALNALEVLVGERPSYVGWPSLSDLAHQATLINPGLPSGLLRRRVDIHRAEYDLAGVQADVAVAQAALMPHFLLTSTTGMASERLLTLFSGAGSWSLAPAISLPLFDGGLSAQQFEGTQSNAALAVVRYEQTAQRAFREVLDALLRQQRLVDTLHRASRQEGRVEMKRSLARVHRDTSVSSRIKRLNQEILHLRAQRNLIGYTGATLQNRIAVIKALGGDEPFWVR